MKLPPNQSILAQVESLLLQHDTSHESSVTTPGASLEYSTTGREWLNEPGAFDFEEPFSPGAAGGQQYFEDDLGSSMGPTFCDSHVKPLWDLMEVGLNEPLPIPEVLDELYDRHHQCYYYG